MREKMEISREFNLVKLNNLLKSLDDSENCAISTESLRCTVCYEIFPGTPMTIQCGHTFCSSCIENLEKSTENYNTTFNCPMCRKPAYLNRAVPNFSVKNILDSMDELGEIETFPVENSRKITLQRLQEENSRLQSQKIKLEDDLETMRNANYFLASQRDEGIFYLQTRNMEISEQLETQGARATKYKVLFFAILGFLGIQKIWS